MFDVIDQNVGMAYDPDGDPNVDPDDLEAIDAVLNDPAAQALVDDLGRQFAALPPEEQIEDLAAEMMKAQERRDSLDALLADAPADDARRVLLEALDNHIEAFRRRIGQVRDQRPT